MIGTAGLATAGFLVFAALGQVNKPVSPDGTAPVGSDDRNPATDQRSTSSEGYVISRDERPDNQPWRTVNEEAGRYAGDTRVTPRQPLPQRYVTIDNKLYPLHTYRTLLQPNDPYGNQWWTSQATLDSAWDVSPGAYQTTLAVIDTGFAMGHEEFVGRWASNQGESGLTADEAPSQLNCTDRGLAVDYACNLVDDDVDGIVDNESGAAGYENPSRLNCTDQGIPVDKSCNRLDDDANGYIDDVTGWDAINQDNSPQAGELNPAGTGTTHGTMVAGTAAATGNNGKGIAGVDWQTKIIPVQALDDDGYGDTRSVGQAIRYATKRNADVINISLGTDYHDPYVSEAIEQATAAGITIVASSGNDGCECVVYPARYPEVIAVGAQTTDGSLASFSSWGSTVDIVAPGTDMVLPSWSSTNGTARYVSGAAGTSFSSPLVAGAISLIKSHQPDATPLQLIAALRETADRSRNTTQYAPDLRYGYGATKVRPLRDRMISPRHDEQLYVFSPVVAGTVYRSGLEAVGEYWATECGPSPTAIAVYEMKRTGHTFYTISDLEARLALAGGYTKANLAYVCLAQPHDTSGAVRHLNIFREFRNIGSKY